ncbi:MAG: MFS transporter [Sporichthyaceae bacterium]|nr:MFS transporter [Sporichthyaceae bacterium]
MSGEPPVRLLTPAFVALTLSDLAYFAATGVLIVVTPLFATGPLGSGEAGVGVAMGSFSVTTLLLRPLAGRWTDRRGRRLLFVGGAIAFTVVVLGHYLVTGLAGLVVVRLLLGVAEALFFVAGFAALADLAPPGRAGEALSLNSLALYLGVALGSVLGQVLLRWGGFDLAWAGAVALGALAILLAARVPETRPSVTPDLPPAPLLHPAALVPGLGLFTGVAAMAGFLAFAVLLARSLGIEAWSLVLLVFGATVVVCRIMFAKLPDRVAAHGLAGLALAAVAAGLVVAGAAQRPGVLIIGTVVMAVGVAFLTPAIFTAVFTAVPASERGSAAATTSIFIDLGLSGGPMVLGIIAALTSIPVALLILAGLPVAGSSLLMVTNFRRTAGT